MDGDERGADDVVAAPARAGPCGRILHRHDYLHERASAFGRRRADPNDTRHGLPSPDDATGEAAVRTDERLDVSPAFESKALLVASSEAVERELREVDGAVYRLVPLHVDLTGHLETRDGHKAPVARPTGAR